RCRCRVSGSTCRSPTRRSPSHSSPRGSRRADPPATTPVVRFRALIWFVMAVEEPTTVVGTGEAPVLAPDHAANGLSTEQVAERVARGLTNDVPDRASRSVKDIVRANVFTRINAILGVLLLIVLATGSIIDGM